MPVAWAAVVREVGAEGCSPAQLLRVVALARAVFASVGPTSELPPGRVDASSGPSFGAGRFSCSFVPRVPGRRCHPKRSQVEGEPRPVPAPGRPRVHVITLRCCGRRAQGVLNAWCRSRFYYLFGRLLLAFAAELAATQSSVTVT